MSLTERLDADLRARLKRGRPLPKMLAAGLGEVVAGPPKVVRVAPLKAAVARVISDEMMMRVDRLEEGTAAVRRSLETSSAMATEIEESALVIATRQARNRAMDLATILAAVSSTFRVTESEITGQGRTADVTHPRFAFCRLAKRHAKQSSTRLGYFLGGRDHTSILNAWKRAEVLMAENEDWRAKYDAAELLLNVNEPIDVVRPQASEL